MIIHGEIIFWTNLISWKRAGSCFYFTGMGKRKSTVFKYQDKILIDQNEANIETLCDKWRPLHDLTSCKGLIKQQ